MKVIIGAAGTTYPGWVSTNKHELDLLNPDDWRKYEPVDMALAEHVWEHLTPEQGVQAAVNCVQYVPRLRVAVPDGLFPDAAYIEHARLGECEGDHNALYTWQSLASIFTIAGYTVRLLEWWDADGFFTYRPWSPDEGMVMRSLRYDARNNGQLGYTSIILDATWGQS